MLIKIILISIFFLITAASGVCYRNKNSDVLSFVAADKNIGSVYSASCFVMSYLSSVIIIGFSGQYGWNFGIASTWIAIGCAFIGSAFAWKLLGCRTRILTEVYSLKTFPEFFEKRFNSVLLRYVVTVISCLLLLPLSVAILRTVSVIMIALFPEFNPVLCIVMITVVIALCVTIGGYRAISLNALIHGLIVIGISVALVLMLVSDNDGFDSCIRALSEIKTEASGVQNGIFTSFFGPDIISLLFVIIFASVGSWALPGTVGSFIAVKDKTVIRKSRIISTVAVLIITCVMFFIGGLGRLFGTADALDRPIGGYERVLAEMVKTLDSDFVSGIFILVVLAASVTALSSIAHNAASYISADIIFPNIKKAISDKKKLFIIKFSVCSFLAVTSLFTILFSVSEYNITFTAELALYSIGTMSAVFIVPYLYGLYIKRITKIAVMICMFTSFGFMTANFVCELADVMFICEFMSSPINLSVIVLFFNFILLFVISLFTPDNDEVRVDKMFSNIHNNNLNN